MGFIKKALFLFIAVVAFLIALLAAADNSAEVALRFLEYQTPVWPISWWMLTAFVIGVVFGNMLNVVSNTRLRMDARRARKTADGRTKELDQSRSQPVAQAPVETP